MIEWFRKKILLLASNPSETGRLRVDEEFREIEISLERSLKREQFELKAAGAVRYRDFNRQVLVNKPNIVHFSGHGLGTRSPAENEEANRKFVLEDTLKSLEGGLVVEDGSGGYKVIDAYTLAGLFRLFAGTVECVVLNACYSQVQAEAIAQYIPFVVGMSLSLIHI